MSLHQFKPKEEITRKLKGQEILEALIQRDLENANGKVSKYIVTHYDVSEEDAKKVIDLLGPKDALFYSAWFSSESQLDFSLYVSDAEKVAQGYVSINELKTSLHPDFLFSVQDSIRKFNLRERQLEQRTYMRPNSDTGTRVSADNPYRSGDTFEHLDSRLDRNPGD